jgi:hypothetical protein
MKSPIIIILGLKISACAFPIHIVAEKVANWTIGQTVQTTSGPVVGHPASNDPQVSEYLGIPYAQPPIGELRFEPPVPFIGTALIDGAALVSFKFSDLNIEADLMGRVSHVHSRIPLIPSPSI